MSEVIDFFSEDQAVDEFFAPTRPARAPVAKAKPRPAHYKVVSISLYTEDIERLGDLVRELKARGHTRASKSALIREALRQIDLDDIPEQR